MSNASENKLVEDHADLDETVEEQLDPYHEMSENDQELIQDRQQPPKHTMTGVMGVHIPDDENVPPIDDLPALDNHWIKERVQGLVLQRRSKFQQRMQPGI